MKKNSSTHSLIISISILLACLGGITAGFPISPGQTVNNVWVKDAKDQPVQIPYLGKKAILIFYVDPDVPKQNDPFVLALKQHHFPDDKFFSFGIVNLKDSPYPNFIVRAMVRRKLDEEKNAVILTDPDRLLQKGWDLGSCDDKSVIILIDRERRVRFFKKGALTQPEISSTIQMILDLVGN